MRKVRSPHWILLRRKAKRFWLIVSLSMFPMNEGVLAVLAIVLPWWGMFLAKGWPVGSAACWIGWLCLMADSQRGVNRILFREAKVEGRIAAAAHPNTPVSELLELARDTEAEVRWALAWRQTLPPEILPILLADKEGEIRRAAFQNFSVWRVLEKKPGPFLPAWTALPTKPRPAAAARNRRSAADGFRRTR